MSTGRKIIFFAVALIVAVGLLSAVSVLAQTTDTYGLNTAGQVNLPQTDLKVAIASIIRIILGFLGIIAVIIVLYGGFVWMTAAGDSGKVDTAKKILLGGLIGLAIILSAFTIVSFIIGQLTGPITPPVPCSPVGATEACGVSGCGSRVCQNSGFWSACDTSACDGPDHSSRYTYLMGFKANSLSWTRALGWSFAGVVSVPPASDLQAKGYGKNTSGSISGMEFWTKAAAGSYAKTSDFAAIPANQPIVVGVYAPWDTSTFSPGNEFVNKLKAIPAGLGSSFESREVNTIIRPAHCFNGVKDGNETGVDCGGDCGACAGASCGSACANSGCASGLCVSSSCLCAATPVVDYISPADDIDNDTNFSNRYKTVGATTKDTWADDIPNGAQGNYVTIWGNNFGSTPGEVWFGDTQANLVFSDDCKDSAWADGQIIVVVPAMALGDAPVVVISSNGLSSNQKIFQVNNIDRPGICNAVPNSGVYPATTNISGIKFPTSGTQNVVWTFQPANLTSPLSTGWTNKSVTDTIPENKLGRTSIRVYNGAQYSNYFRFLITRGQLGDPCGFDTATCASSNICQTGLVCDPTQNCTCRWAPNICGDNTLGPEEDCDKVGGADVFPGGKNKCSDYGYGTGAVSCNTECHLDTSKCSGGPLNLKPATYSLYAWSFKTAIADARFGAPYVVEDCSRFPDCREGQRLPSPTPWSEGWNLDNYPSLHIENDQACLNAIISARFNVRMDPASVQNNVTVLNCANRDGDDCSAVTGTVDIRSDNNSWDDDYFVFHPNQSLAAGRVYKVIVRQGARSYTFVPLKVETDKINERHCNVWGITDAAYCWNFETRVASDPNLNCPEGCVECSPDPAWMYWWGATTLFSSNLDSADNVCLMVDPTTRSWTWSSDKPFATTFSAASANEITGTAEVETIFDTPNPYAKITAALSSGKNDYCKNYNDFTNPIVIEDQSCSQLPQSPSPWINSRDACRNAMVSARFSRPMVDSTLDKENIIVQVCPDETTALSPTGSCSANLITNNNQIQIFSYSQVIETSVDPNNLARPLAEGFQIYPCHDLAANTVFRVVILGGSSGVRGSRLVQNADGTWRDTNEPQGILLTPSIRSGWDYNGDGKDDYFWTYKTANQICPVSQAQITPKDKFMRLVGETQQYDVHTQAPNCNELDPRLYNWNWKSYLSVDTNGEGADGSGVATISQNNNSSDVCVAKSSLDITGFIAPTQTATGRSEGLTYIRAKEPSGKFDSGRLQVGLGDLRVLDNYKPKDTVKCSNADGEINFTLDVKSSSINGNVKLYQCADNDAGCSITGIVANPLTFTNLNTFTNQLQHFLPPLAASKSYRVVVMGGSSGVEAQNGKKLSGLNFSTTGGTGEECESNLSPWNTKPGVCDTTCRLAGDLCGTTFAQCAKDSAYCSATCHNAGNSNIASCGNGKIETGEECDDGNITSGDGCKNNCTWEGANVRYGSVCGNGRKEKGEGCDDGNTASGDGCSATCLPEAGRLAGSNPNAPICGNSVVETGESCDDGNTVSDDGCHNNCLKEGSSNGATCGNGLVENGRGADSFSWVFKMDNQVTVCQPVELLIPPCPNGIWRVSLDSNIESATVKIQKKGSVNGSGCEEITTSFRQAPFAWIVQKVAAFFGRTASAALYWCPLTSETYTFATWPNQYHLDQNNFETIGYRNEDNRAVLNYLKDVNWEYGATYRAVVEYRLGGADNRIAQPVTIVPDAAGQGLRQDGSNYLCQVDKVATNVWPTGEAKTLDNFFCDRDDCGSGTADPYLQDQDTAVPGNQHLYRAWSINNSLDSKVDYIVKSPQPFIWNLDKNVAVVPNSALLGISNTNLTETAYSGDQWVTVKSVDREGANMSGVDALVWATEHWQNKSATTTIDIFLCDNPWPSADHFPFFDSTGNCTAGNTTNCPNTNFKMYYCRGQGAPDSPNILPAFDYNTIIGSANAAATVKEFLFKFDSGTDALGLRVMPNLNHLSPLAWYRATFAANRQGTPQAAAVDGYAAVKEGRTIYINATDLSDNRQTAYSNIYLLSYNQGARATSTINIYNQLTKYFFFNAGANADGGLDTADVGGLYNPFGHCTGGGSGFCLNDRDCQKANLGYCDSDKAKLVRDTKRLGDLTDIDALLNKFYSVKRCQKDQSKTCTTASQCPGGACDYYYPALPSGTYIAGRTLSVWPSWQDTLGNALAAVLPSDPVNKLTGCPAGTDTATCWSEANKEMKCPSGANIYAYFGTAHAIAVNEAGKVWLNPATDYLKSFAGANLCGAGPVTCNASAKCGDPDYSDGTNCNNCRICADRCTSSEYCAFQSNKFVCSPKQSTSTDWDSDGRPNNTDVCPWDYNKQTSVGACGCGALWTGGRQTDPSPGHELDSDGDGTPDCKDECPNSADYPGKIKAGVCGCLVSEVDSDGDGTPDCKDTCKDDPRKTKPGSCGCGAADVDTDHDGIMDCHDNCPKAWNSNQRDTDHDGVGDVCDNCLNVPNGNPASQATCYVNPATQVQIYDAAISAGKLTAPDKATWTQDDKDFFCNQKNDDIDIFGNACDRCPTCKDDSNIDSDGNGTCDSCEAYVCGDLRVTGDEQCDCGNPIVLSGADATIAFPAGATPPTDCVKKSADNSQSICQPGQFDFTVNIPKTGNYDVMFKVVNIGAFGIRHFQLFINDQVVTARSPVIPTDRDASDNYIIETWTFDSNSLAQGSQKISIKWWYDGGVTVYNNTSFKIYDLTVAATGTTLPSLCTSMNNVPPPLTYASRAQDHTVTYCGTNTDIAGAPIECQKKIQVNYFCGDGQLQTTGGGEEECDDTNSGGPADGCVDATCKFSCPNFGQPYQSQNLTLSQSSFNSSPGTVTFPAASCRVSDKLSADITINGTVRSAAVVFVSDVSNSMSSNLNSLKTALGEAIDRLSPIAKIGLVHFSGPAYNDVTNTIACPQSLCGLDQISSLKSIVNGYTATTDDSTYINEGLMKAKGILDVTTADHKIIILMSDGEPFTSIISWFNIVEEINGAATSLKNTGIKIYSLAFTSNISQKAAMNYWSSNIGSGNNPDSAPQTLTLDWGAGYGLRKNYSQDGCLSNYCQTNSSALVDSVIGVISAGLPSGVVVTVDGETTNLPGVLPNPNGSAKIYTNQPINLPTTFCSSASHNLRVAFNGSGTVTLASTKSSYCPALDPSIPHITSSGAKGQVAGESETSFWARLVEGLKNFFSVFVWWR